MGLTRALLEAGLLWISATAGIFLWKPPAPVGWADLLVALQQAVAPSLCFVVSFYYNDLYDAHIVHGFRDLAVRIPQAFGVGFILLAACYMIFPDVRISNGAFAMSVMAILGVLLPLRALSYTLMRRRPFLERVLILGRGPLAEKILREVAVRPYLGYEVTDVADEQGQHPRGDPRRPDHRGAGGAPSPAPGAAAPRRPHRRQRGRGRGGRLRAAHREDRHRIADSQQPDLLTGLQEVAVRPGRRARGQPADRDPWTDLLRSFSRAD